MSDETYLESFMEQITTLPNEVKRNLELLKVLDRSCSTMLEELQRRQQEYLDYAEGRAMELELVVETFPASTEDEEGMMATFTSATNNNNNNNNVRAGLRVPGDPSIPAVIPTTEELEEYILRHANAELFQHIQMLQTDVLQQAEEKVAVASQTYALVDGIVQRLDADLIEMETLLQSTGAFYASVEGGSGGSSSPKPGDLAAIQVNPTSAPNDWILAKIISHDLQTGYYKLSDEDIESNKIFHLPESQVVVLSGNSDLKLSRGDAVFAIYPDTTSFYPATVVQPPPRRTTSGSANSVEPFCTVHFVDDSDEHGITHEKAVLMKHVMSPP